MLSRISRLGARFLNRARPGQSSVTSRNHEVETIRSYMNHVVPFLFDCGFLDFLSIYCQLIQKIFHSFCKLSICYVL